MNWWRVVSPVRITIPIGLVLAGMACASAVLASTTGWTVQPSPNPHSSSALNGVAATSSTNAWAVGDYNQKGAYKTLILHWNGKAWTVAPSSKHGGKLNGVAATSSTNAWAVGVNGGYALIVHWNGKAWTVAPSAKHGGKLNGVAATSSTNAWAVGNNRNLLIERWNGRAWKVASSPNIGRYTSPELNAVAATSSANAWAVGDYNRKGAYKTLIVHWNGKAWTVQPSPVGAAALYGVAATSSTNAWAVGENLIEHWNGRAWRVEPSPPLPSTCQNYGVTLNGVAATSSTNAWAVGSCGYYNGASGSAGISQMTVIEHWNGKVWKLQKSPNPFGYDDELYGSAAVSSRDAWAVGVYEDDGTVPLILRWNGTG